jgi:hypothetical protein
LEIIMNRWLILAFLTVLCVPAAAGEDNGARPGNPRAYEHDVLLETFGFTQEDIDVPLDSLFQGCPARDCIPSIDNPEFVSASEAVFLNDDDLILGVVRNGVTRAYAARILNHHEIVNDDIGKEPVAVTYCPLCGSGVAFLRTLDGVVMDFGVSGVLHNNDLVLYDRQSESLWQQITGEAFAGTRRGQVLTAIPVSMSFWGDWRKAHPDTAVLAPPADSKSDYSGDQMSGYEKSERLIFPVSLMDARLHPKKVVYGFTLNANDIALDAEWLLQQGEWRHTVDNIELLVRITEDGGVSVTANGETLIAHRMFWFAWYSFHPGTSLIDGS